MQQKYILEKPENRRLILFFTGWSTDWRIIEEIILPSGYDLLCCWDYRVLSSPVPSKDYDEIMVIAWSFGINAAQNILPVSSFINKVTGMYAINGTLYPVDNEKGIPCDIFKATCDNLNEENLKRFRIRIAGGKSKYQAANKRLKAQANIEDLKEELKLFGKINNLNKKGCSWDYAFISENDKIFPMSNLVAAWKNTPFSIIKDGEHLPDFQRIFDLVIKDKKAIGKIFEKASKSYADNARVQNEIAKRLFDFSLNICKKGGKILEIGSGAGLLNRHIISNLNPAHFCVIDLGKNEYDDNVEFIKGDIEVVIRKLQPEYFDMVISGSTMQWLHSPLRVILQIERILKPGGYFIFSTFLKGNLKEISEQTGNSLLYLTEDQWKNTIEKTGLEIVVSETQEHVLRFDEVKEIFGHLKSTGVNALTGKNKSIKELREIMRNYPQDNGKYTLSYVSYIMVLRKPTPPSK